MHDRPQPGDATPDAAHDAGGSHVASTPQPPYYAVIFTSRRSACAEGYELTAQRMLELAAGQDGFLGVESVREGVFGITVSYWRDLESLRRWREQAEHREAQRQGRARWYEHYSVRVCRVERAYGMEPAQCAAQTGEQRG